MLFDSSQTPYDLRFQLLGFPVRIHPGFWVISLIVGPKEPRSALVWIFAVFVSILVHELGHAVLQRFYGGRPWIVLYTFGGYSATEGVDRDWWKTILIALAGPGAGFLLFGVVFALLLGFGPPANPYLSVAAEYLLLINLAWGLINLAPIWPLDGGHVARELLTRFLRPAKGIELSLWLSIISAALVAALLWSRTGSIWNLVLFGMLGYQSYQTLVAYRRSRGAW